MATRTKQLLKQNGTDASGLEGARRATGEPLAPARIDVDPEVVAVAKRRQFSPAYKRQMVRAVSVLRQRYAG